MENNASTTSQEEELTIKELIVKFGKYKQYVYSKWKVILIVA